MRPSFRVLLPAAQAALTIAIALSNFGAPQFRMASRCDWEATAICTPLFPATIVRLVEINLPALPILAPLYVWLGGDLDHPNLPLLVTLFGTAGIGLWFFVGQFLDDVAEALVKHRSPKRRIHYELLFVLIIISSCAVLTESHIIGMELSSSELGIRIYSLSWLVFGCTALLSQICFNGKDELATGFIAGRRS